MTPFVFSYLSHGLYSVTDIICNWNTLGGAATLKFQAYYDYTHTALNIIIATSNHLTTTAPILFTLAQGHGSLQFILMVSISRKIKPIDLGLLMQISIQQF